MNNDFDILVAKFVLSNDFSLIQEEFEKLCELGNTEVLKHWYRLYSIGDNPFIDGMVDNFKELSEKQTLELSRKLIDLEYKSDDWHKVDRALMESHIKSSKSREGSKKKSDKTQILTNILNKDILFTDENADKVISTMPTDYKGFNRIDLECCVYKVLTGKPSKKVITYLKWVASQPYSVDLTNYQLKGKPKQSEIKNAPSVQPRRNKESKSIFEETLLYWHQFSKSEKIKHLQMYEIVNAKLHSREEREINIVKAQETHIPNLIIGGHFDRECPTTINISSVTLNEKDAIASLDVTYHEGYHAFFNDFMKDKVHLKTMGEYGNTQNFKAQYKDNLLTILSLFHTLPEKRDAISNHFNDFYFEEQVVYKESLIYAIYNLLKMADRTNIQIVLDKYLYVLFQYSEHEKRMKKIPFTKADVKRAEETKILAYNLIDNYISKQKGVKRMLNLGDDASSLIERAIIRSYMQLTKQQLDMILKLMERSLKQLSNNEIVQIKSDFEQVSELIK